MKREIRNGQPWVDCSICGQMFPVEKWMETLCEDADFRHCDKCNTRIAEEQKRRAWAESLPQRADAAGIPELYRLHRVTGNTITQPLVPHVARWIWENRESNLLISGRTGVGKSTSACFCALRLLADGKSVRYVKLRRLLAEWRDARTSDAPGGDERFFDAIRRLDVLILDEVADKTKTTESGQEMMYELLDMISDGEIKTRLWMLGNFRDGTLKDIFGDDEPVYRRIDENFLCVGAKPVGMEIFRVWKNEQKRG